MNVEYGNPQPETGRQVILVNGETVGHVDPYYSEFSGNRFHAVISLPVEGSVSIHGFSATKEDAIIDAIERGKRTAVDTLNEISVLGAKVFPRSEIIEPPLAFGL